jgi:dihydrodipicolinate synthase/N-acetylneuraminate lyase
MVRLVIKGALAAAVTPFRDDGSALDEDAFGPLAELLAAGGLDGILAMGTTGEGILLSPAERRRVTELFVTVCSGRLDVAVHCGAQTTADTVALAEHAAASGADAVAVIGPPYFQLDDEALLAHLVAAATACAPTPFYVYEFAKVSGYAVPVRVVEELQEAAPNLAGMKVSDAPFDKLEPYLLEGLDIFVGAESLIGAGMERGAKGAVSALATAFPELVAAAVRNSSAERSAELGELRAGLEAFPRHAALKRIIGLRGVALREDVRRPLRGLTGGERRALDAWATAWVARANEERSAEPSERRPA